MIQLPAPFFSSPKDPLRLWDPLSLLHHEHWGSFRR